MSAGIYMNNGVLAYSMNLEKKLKRRKNASIIEEYTGDLTGEDLEKELQRMLDKHLDIVKTVEIIEDKPLKYHWINRTNNHTICSIYSDLNNIPNIKKDEWIRIS